MKNMCVLVFVGNYIPGYKGGGPIKTIKNLVDKTGDSINYKVITRDRDLNDKQPYTSVQRGKWNKVGKANVFYVHPGFYGCIQMFFIILRGKYDVVYLNSFFSPMFSIYPLVVAKLLKKKVIISPRGEFSEGALSLKSFKKKMFLKVFWFFRLSRGVLFQASSDFEAMDVRRSLGKKVNIYVAENISSQEFAKNIECTPSDNVLKAVFVSRISPKKNILEAINILRSVRNPVEYHIYGPVEDVDYWKSCQSLVSQLPAHVLVKYKGELKPEKVIETLSKYDVFFFPTKGENYGHVIVEAICAGLPVLISDRTPWRDLNKNGIGWDIPLENPAAFSLVLDDLSQMSPEQRLVIRQNVLSWAKEHFSRNDAVESNVQMFNCICQKR